MFHGGRFLRRLKSVLIKELSGSKDLVIDTGIIYTVASGLSKSKLRIPVRIKTKIEGFITSIGNIASSLNEALTDNCELNEVCDYFCEIVQPAILAEIHEKAPKAKIYWTNIYNPYYGTKLDLKELFSGIETLDLSKEALESLKPVDLGKYGATYIEKMNRAFEINTDGYTVINLYDRFNEAGLTNVSISRDQGEDSESLQDDILELGVDPHPNAKGHKLIYDIVMPVIDTTYIPGDDEFTMSFDDVKKTDWFYNAIGFAFEKGLMNGTSDKTFEPYGKATRAMVATVLWRMAGKPAVVEDISFKDVIPGHWYENAIKWAKNSGIANGLAEDLFGPDEFITREQLVTFIYRYANAKEIKKENSADISLFTDAEKISDFAIDAFNWAIGTGIITGKGENNLDPHGYATSAELATMLKRFFDNGYV